jgi:hypothetical protein
VLVEMISKDVAALLNGSAGTGQGPGVAREATTLRRSPAPFLGRSSAKDGSVDLCNHGPRLNDGIPRRRNGQASARRRDDFMKRVFDPNLCDAVPRNYSSAVCYEPAFYEPLGEHACGPEICVHPNVHRARPFGSEVEPPKPANNDRPKPSAIRCQDGPAARGRLSR